MVRQLRLSFVWSPREFLIRNAEVFALLVNNTCYLKRECPCDANKKITCYLSQKKENVIHTDIAAVLLLKTYFHHLLRTCHHGIKIYPVIAAKTYFQYLLDLYRSSRH